MPGRIGERTSPKFVTRALSGHSALGLTTAAFLYILTVSGTISIFNHELQRWEQPGAPELTSISPEAAERAAVSMLAIEEIPTSHFFIQLPTDDLPRVVLTTDTRAVVTDGTGAIVTEESHPWTQFVLDLHFYLHLPEKVGLTVVGMLGVLLLGSSISGFLAHPSIFRDAFAFRFSGSARLAQADLHNRLSVWTSPFHLSIALTGAVLGLASITAFAIATLNQKGEFIQSVGMVDGKIGQQIIASIYPLHFGSFGSLPVKAAYALFGVILAYIISSGFNVYLLKQREKGNDALRLEAAWTGVLWGTPAALSLALLGSVTGIIPAEALPAVFWLSLGLALFITVMAPKWKLLGQWLRGGTGVVLLIATFAHLYIHKENFTAPAATSTTIVFIVIALTFLLPLVKASRTS